MTVQTRRYRNTLRSAFLALMALVAILGATLVIGGRQAAHAAPMTPVVHAAHAISISPASRFMPTTPPRPHIATGPLNAYPCQYTIWITNWGNSSEFALGEDQLQAGIGLLVDSSQNWIYCGEVESWAIDVLGGGCMHFNGLTYNLTTGANASPFNIYHCTQTRYVLNGPQQSLSCNSNQGLQTQNWDSYNNTVYSPTFIC